MSHYITYNSEQPAQTCVSASIYLDADDAKDISQHDQVCWDFSSQRTWACPCCLSRDPSETQSKQISTQQWHHQPSVSHTHTHAHMHARAHTHTRLLIQESRAVARKPRDAAAVLGLKFANDIHYKLKSSQASKARLQSSKDTSIKENLTQNGDSRPFKVTCFGVSGKAIRH